MNQESSEAKWSKIVQCCFEHFDNFKGEKCIVPNSIPILYFGDYAEYLASPVKVVTVALNPSNWEFPQANPQRRFKYSVAANSSLSEKEYRDSLNDYFNSCPYDWFDKGFEKVLSGFGASFYGKRENTVLHTDFCTPIATSPTWGKLGSNKDDPDAKTNKPIKEKMMKEGAVLWHNLIELLQPDVLFVCLNQGCKIKYQTLGEPTPLFESPNNEPEKAIDHRIILMGSGKKTLMISGKTRGYPFGAINDERKSEVGHIARDIYDNREWL